MRRIDDGHAARPPPFRVLAPPDPNYLSPAVEPPPPPRAPEPYKVAPSTTSFARAHRRSSFVIIADSRPTSPESRSPSPTLATGRVSPFRGRGFKGPPPRSKSRPQSPEAGELRRKFRNDRRVSVSQQNSPRRSLIPQPTRQRSTSLTKPEDRSSSPKIGRRVDSRTRLNTTESRNRLNATGSYGSTNNLLSRRPSTKAGNKLSPIQGTPTKFDRNTPLTRRNERARNPRISPAKATRSTNSPTKNAANQRRTGGQEKGSTKEKFGSPSRIPLKTARNTTNSLNPPRFITLPNQSSDKGNRKVERAVKEVNDDRKDQEQVANGVGTDGSSKESDRTTSSEKASDLDLREILKLSSGATGTSTVVTTTATTATQPLHIDANTVLVDKIENEKKSNPDQTKAEASASASKSSNSPKASDDASSNRQSQSTTDDQKSQNLSSKPSKPGSSYNRTKAIIDSKTNSPVIRDTNGHSKTSSISQSAKVISRINGMGSATQRRTPNDATLKSSKSIDVKAADEIPRISTTSASPSTQTRSSEFDLEKTGSSQEKNSKESGDSKTASRVIGEADPNIISTASMVTGDSSVLATSSSNSNGLSTNTNASGGVNDAELVNSRGARVRNATNRGSNSSLKSSVGASNDSIESARSTDTGVSVNTVRGVSSPREKTGVHVVKREQEIETLSGNIMHLEQNGEPALLAANSATQEQEPERLLSRWKKSLGRACGCCSNMRCLACRTDPKGLSWFKNNAKLNKPIAKTRSKVQEQPPPENATETAKIGCWSRLKNRCRCNRVREIKCCARKARVAPAESTTCCPPERRFGALCRRIFDKCKCKRAEPERRNVRAKHSLTSVAPPPLSEEPKAKIPDVLVEHNSLMRGAIPCLPVPLAWFCLVWNVLLPGSGTVWSGIFNLCSGQPRFSQVAGLKSRLGAFVVNLVVGVGQLFTVLFCLVGWGWSIWWGVTLVRLARKYRRFKASEAASNDPEARGADGALPPGVPSQALREMERAR